MEEFLIISQVQVWSVTCFLRAASAVCRISCANTASRRVDKRGAAEVGLTSTAKYKCRKCPNEAGLLCILLVI